MSARIVSDPLPLYVYMFWSHDEYGPKDLVATVDRSKVIDLAKQIGEESPGWFDKSDPIGQLEQLLLKSDSELEGKHNLMRGWGGLHFQVVKLYE